MAPSWAFVVHLEAILGSSTGLLGSKKLSPNSSDAKGQRIHMIQQLRRMLCIFNAFQPSWCPGCRVQPGAWSFQRIRGSWARGEKEKVEKMSRDEVVLGRSLGWTWRPGCEVGHELEIIGLYTQKQTYNKYEQIYIHIYMHINIHQWGTTTPRSCALPFTHSSSTRPGGMREAIK